VRGSAGQPLSAARFYLDGDVPHKVAEIGAALDLDLLAAKDAHASLPQADGVHLARAGEGGRIMVTYNRNDFLLATREMFQAGRPHAGLLILTRKLPRDPVRIAHALERWVAARKEEGNWPLQPYEVAFLSQ
jgi:hypothetical protein